MRESRRFAATWITSLLLTASTLGQELRDSSARIAVAIAELGSAKSEAREAASRLLEGLGPAALPLLRDAGQHADAEIRRCARLLVRQIERRVDTERILKPTTVRLSFHDVLVAEAAADLGRQTGFRLSLDGNRALFTRRALTMDLPETNVWDALAQFCDKAGLVDTIAAMPVFDASRYDGWDRGTIDVSELPDGSAVQPGLSLRFKQGDSPALPVFHVGSVRLRVLPSGTPLPHQTRATGEVLLGLEVGLEARLRPIAVMAVRIDHARDDRGQVLTQPAASIAGGGAFAGGQREEIVLAWEGETVLPADLPGGIGPVPIRLRAPGQSPRHLKELRGVLAIQVQGPEEALITVDGLSAERPEAKGSDGSSLKVIELRQEFGAIKLRAEVAPAPRDLFLSGLPARILLVNGGRWRGRGLTVPPPVHARQIVLLDEKGVTIGQVGTPTPTVGSNGAAWDFTLQYQPAPGQGSPRKLVYQARRTLTVEIPFIFQDIPL